MTTYALVLITVAAPMLVLALGRPGVWASLGLVALFVVAHAIANVLGARRARRAYERGRCTRCGYDIRASTRRCPECGDELMSQATWYWRGRFG